MVEDVLKSCVFGQKCGEMGKSEGKRVGGEGENPK